MLQFSAFADSSVMLAWNPSISTNVVGYKIYYGVASGVYENTIYVAGSTNASVTGLVEGTTYYFAATAVNSLGVESPFSNETSYSVPTAPANTPPTLDSLSDMVINENAGPQMVDLSGISSGATNETQTLTVTAVSSNPGLIPNPTVNYSSPNPTGTLSFAPVTGGAGTAIITVTVNDNATSNNIIIQSFTVTVNAVSQQPSASPAPTLDPLSDLVVVQNSGKQIVSLTGISSGLTNKIQMVTVRATSSNTQLISTPTIGYLFPNSYGSLSFTPAVNETGTSVISVTVNNGQAASNVTTRSFTVTVLPSGGSAPQIVGQSTNVTALAGQAVTLSVAAVGTAPMTYHWQCNSNVLPFATNAVLNLTGVKTNQTGCYCVTVSNALGTTNTMVALTVYPTAAAKLATVVPPASGQFALSVNGMTGYKYVVQVSTNLASWDSVLTNTAPFTFVDTNANQFKQRYYRSVYLP